MNNLYIDEENFHRIIVKNFSPLRFLFFFYTHARFDLAAVRKFIIRRHEEILDQRVVSYGTSFSRRSLPRRAPSLPAPPAIPRGTGADCINEHAPPPAPYYPYPHAAEGAPCNPRRCARSADLCYFLRRPLPSPPDKGGAEVKSSEEFSRFPQAYNSDGKKENCCE